MMGPDRMVAAAIVIQNFNKPDTLDALCESLLKCSNRQQFDLIFWSDSPLGSRRGAKYLLECAEVERLLTNFAATHGDEFRSITLQRNQVNLGAYKTCEVSIDGGFEKHDFVIFSEDDTVFAPDALDWFMAMATSPIFLDDSVWAIAGESFIFDARRAVPDERLVEAAKLYAITNRLWDKFTLFDWIPSTCFATSRQKWRQFSETRGATNGDSALGRRCRDEGKKCLYPVVARVKDTGMLHPDGYSVSIHTQDKVQNVKNCYLMSSDILPASGEKQEFRLFEGNIGGLFSQLALLSGVQPKPESAPVETAPVICSMAPTLEAARKAGVDGKWELALRLWRELKEGGQPTLEVDISIGRCLLKTGKRDEARAAIESVLLAHPDEPSALVILAYILEASKDFAGAGDIWSRLRDQTGLPEWIYSGAADGALRCKAVAIAKA